MNLGFLLVQGPSVDPIGCTVVPRNHFVSGNFTDREILGLENPKSEKVPILTKCEGSAFRSLAQLSIDQTRSLLILTEQQDKMDL